MIEIKDERVGEFHVLTWRGVAGDRIRNGGGVGVDHETRVTVGRCRFEVAGRQPQVLRAGESIRLPLRTAYSVIAETDGEIQCSYPVADPLTERELSILRSNGQTAFRPFGRHRAAATAQSGATIQGVRSR